MTHLCTNVNQAKRRFLCQIFCHTKIRGVSALFCSSCSCFFLTMTSMEYLKCSFVSIPIGECKLPFAVSVHIHKAPFVHSAVFQSMDAAKKNQKIFRFRSKYVK